MKCSACGLEKPDTEFPPSNQTASGLYSQCRICKRKSNKRYEQSVKGKLSARRKHLKKRFGMSLQEYEEKLARQGGVCEICGIPKDEVLDVDHNHSTGKVRGLLCFRCNSGLGMFGDEPELLLKAVDYLRRHNVD